MKNTKILGIILISAFLFTACAQKQVVKQSEQQKPVQNNQEEEKPDQPEIGPEILETDIDTSDWVEYRSGVYEYSFKLPKDFIFVDEYRGEQLEYSPQQTNFVINDPLNSKNDDEILHNSYLSVREKNIDDFIDDRERESGQDNVIRKLFSKNDIDYYYRTDSKHKDFIPTILHHDSIIIILSYESKFNIEKFKAIINSIKFYTDYCSAIPTFADNGRKINPINKDKYKSEEFIHIGFLGELFTADDCGKERVNELFKNQYNDGLTIWVSPTDSLTKTLGEIGFECSDETITKDICEEWKTEETIFTEDLIKLKPYYLNIKLSDCIWCG